MSSIMPGITQIEKILEILMKHADAETKEEIKSYLNQLIDPNNHCAQYEKDKYSTWLDLLN